MSCIFSILNRFSNVSQYWQHPWRQQQSMRQQQRTGWRKQMQEPPIPGNKKHDNGPHGLLMFTVNLPWASRKDAYWPIDTYKSCICLTSGYTNISCFETFIARPWTAITWASLWWFRSSFAIEWLQHGPIRDLKRPWLNHSIPYRTIVYHSHFRQTRCNFGLAATWCLGFQVQEPYGIVEPGAPRSLRTRTDYLGSLRRSEDKKSIWLWQMRIHGRFIHNYSENTCPIIWPCIHNMGHLFIVWFIIWFLLLALFLNICYMSWRLTTRFTGTPPTHGPFGRSAEREIAMSQTGVGSQHLSGEKKGTQNLAIFMMKVMDTLW